MHKKDTRQNLCLKPDGGRGVDQCPLMLAKCELVAHDKMHRPVKSVELPIQNKNTKPSSTPPTKISQPGDATPPDNTFMLNFCGMEQKQMCEQWQQQQQQQWEEEDNVAEATMGHTSHSVI